LWCALFTKDDNNQSRSSETLDEMIAQRSADAGAELAEGKAPPPPAADFPRVYLEKCMFASLTFERVGADFLMQPD
jgi:hypothetical protein